MSDKDWNDFMTCYADQTSGFEGAGPAVGCLLKFSSYYGVEADVLVDAAVWGGLVETAIRLAGGVVLTWTPHGFKHFAPKNVPWKKVVESTKGTDADAKYLPGSNVRSLETTAWENGTPTTNGKTWKVYKFNQIIGASEGKETQYVRVEMTSGNTIHGHPITEEEYFRLIK